MRLSDYRAVGLAIGSRSRITTPTQKTASMDFDEGSRGQLGKLKKFNKLSLFINCPRRYMVEILPIHRKTLYNQPIFLPVWKDLTLLKK